MKRLAPASFAFVLFLAGCQGVGDSGPRDDAAGAPASGVPESCAKACNTQYDSCMSRFSAIPGAQRLARPDDPTYMEGPNGVCPDQLRACFKRCSL